MNKHIKEATTYWLIGVVVLLTSVAVHEGVHWVQGMADPRIEPLYVGFGCGENGDSFPGYVYVHYEYTTDDPIARFNTREDSWRREMYAYGIQIIFCTIVILLIFEIFYKRGFHGRK